MKFKSPSIINFEEGVYLNTEIINSISVREIQVDYTGNMAWAIVCYPDAGAGFVVSKHNEKDSAMEQFQLLLAYLTEQEGDTVLSNNFVQPEPKEPEKLEIDLDSINVETTDTEEKGE